MTGVAVYLPMEQWNQILSVLAQAPWNIANPLIMAMGDQLRPKGLHEDAAAAAMNQARGNAVDRDPPS